MPPKGQDSNFTTEQAKKNINKILEYYQLRFKNKNLLLSESAKFLEAIMNTEKEESEGREGLKVMLKFVETMKSRIQKSGQDPEDKAIGLEAAESIKILSKNIVNPDTQAVTKNALKEAIKNQKFGLDGNPKPIILGPSAKSGFTGENKEGDKGR